jgi:sortase A
MSAGPGGSKVRRALRALSTVLIVSGLLLIVDAVLTVVWQEPVSWAYAQLQQGELSDELSARERNGLDAEQARLIRRLPGGDRRIAFAARALAREVEEGEPVGRIRLPRIGLDTVVVHGTDGATLRKGPGHYPTTPLPGVRGTVAIAGHRTTYGAPFRRVDELRAGDEVEVRMPYATFTYRVERTRIVAPDALWVTRRVAHDRLVLSACHPLYSAAQRIVVFARLTASEPRGSALN